MDFDNLVWNNDTKFQYIKYLESFKNTEEKIARRITIVNTSMEVLAFYSKESKEIVNNIRKTNIKDFLNLNIFNYYEDTSIYGSLIGYLKEFSDIKYHLNILNKYSDNWATVDNIPFKLIIKKHKEELYELSNEYIKSPETFVRRTGVKILFEYINVDNYNNLILSTLNKFSDESEYYVNMVIGWLLCDMFIKARDITLDFFINNDLNKRAINIGIQKCRDSFRVSNSDKELLLKYKK